MNSVVKCSDCEKPAIQGYALRLGGGYGQESHGCAIYYGCADHLRTSKQNTDMSRLVSTWEVKNA